MKSPDPITAEGYCRGGVIKWRTAWRFIKAAVKSWPDGPVVFTLAVKKDTRSIRANRWLFGVVYRLMLLEMCGKVTETLKDELHEAMKLRHNRKRTTDPITGQEIEVGGGTKRMTVEEFSDFIEAVMLDGSEAFGIVWPEPRRDEDWRERKERAA